MARIHRHMSIHIHDATPEDVATQHGIATLLTGVEAELVVLSNGDKYHSFTGDGMTVTVFVHNMIPQEVAA